MSFKERDVAYKPLGFKVSPDDCCEYIDNDSCDEEDELYSRKCPSRQTMLPRQVEDRLRLEHLRIILYVIAIILFLIFMAQLTTNDRASKHTTRRESSSLALKLPSNEPISHKHQIGGRELTSENPQEFENQFSYSSTKSPQLSSLQSKKYSELPKYESYLESVLKSRNSLNSLGSDREPIDDLHMDNFRQTKSQWWTVNFRNSNKYIAVTNYIRAMKSFNSNSSITLTTQATIEFMHHTLELCKRWDGPISVAVFGPGEEFQVAITLIKYMRQCLPPLLSACIRDKVTWHLVYDRAYGPEPELIKSPHLSLDAQNYPLFVNQDKCPKLAGPQPEDAIRQFGQRISMKNHIYPSNYRQIHKLTYPINVLRNTARLAATTRYVLSSDIELYPSLNIVPMFEKFLSRHKITEEYYYVQKYIFTLPIFEVKTNVTVPKTKTELVKLFENGDAVFFHKYVCDICQNFPNRTEWLRSDKLGVENYHEANSDELVIFSVTQRGKERSSWEPIYIGTNDDPLYDDRLTWNGRRDKMAQMYELCLQDYHLFILGNAFLVHAPGIKHIDQNEMKSRYHYMRENNGYYDSIIKNLREQYVNSSTVDRC